MFIGLEANLMPENGLFSAVFWAFRAHRDFNIHIFNVYGKFLTYTLKNKACDEASPARSSMAGVG
jgi:hypothetical protein